MSEPAKVKRPRPTVQQVAAMVKARLPHLVPALRHKDGRLYIVAESGETYKVRKELAWDDGRGMGFSFRPAGWDLVTNGKSERAFWRHSCEKPVKPNPHFFRRSASADAGINPPQRPVAEPSLRDRLLSAITS